MLQRSSLCDVQDRNCIFLQKINKCKCCTHWSKRLLNIPLSWKRHNAFLCTMTMILWHVVQRRLVPRYRWWHLSITLHRVTYKKTTLRTLNITSVYRKVLFYTRVRFLINVMQNSHLKQCISRGLWGLTVSSNILYGYITSAHTDL